MNWKRFGLGTVVLLIIAGIVGGYWYYQRQQFRQSPQYALEQIREAARTGNPLMLERHVDVDGFTQALVDELFTYAAQDALSGEDESGTEGSSVGTLLGVSLGEQYKPVAASLLESSIKRAIETGRADSVFENATAADSVEADQLLAPTGIEPSGFRGLTDINRVDDLATVGLKFYNAPLDSTVTFQLKMEQSEGRWRVTEAYNLTRLLQDVESRRQVLIDSANARVTRLIDSLNIRSDYEVVEDCVWEDNVCSDYLRLSASLTNSTDRTVDLVRIELTGYTSQSAPYYDTIMSFSDNLSPGQSQTMTVTFNDPSQVALIERAGVRTFQVEFESGGPYFYVHNWDDYLRYYSLHLASDTTEEFSQEESRAD